MIYQIYIETNGYYKKINGFYIKGLGRFTRRQRASVYKNSKGKLHFRSFNSNISLHVIDVITRYGKCTIRLYINYNLRYQLIKNKYSFYFI